MILVLEPGPIGTQALLSPKEYLGLSKEQRASVVRVQSVPPRLGHAGFGQMRVTFDRPTYTLKHGR